MKRLEVIVLSAIAAAYIAFGAWPLAKKHVFLVIGGYTVADPFVTYILKHQNSANPLDLQKLYLNFLIDNGYGRSKEKIEKEGVETQKDKPYFDIG